VEFATRLEIFAKAEERIAELNGEREHPDDALFGWTKYSDWHPEEFGKLLGFKRSDADRTTVPYNTAQSTLKSLDWRSTGMVTPVKDQGDCGSCWAFSAVEGVESAALMAGTAHAKTLLSEQQVVSCDTDDDGCDGGDLPSAWKYVQGAGGLESETTYPYTSGTSGKTKRCKNDKDYVSDTSPKNWTYATKPCNYGGCKKQDENALGTSLTNFGPISICVDAASDNWQNYMSGVMTPKQCGSSNARSMDHCVQLVGMQITDDESSKNYWIVRNSWNTDWGDKGYIHLEMGDNTCGIANEALYLTL